MMKYKAPLILVIVLIGSGLLSILASQEAKAVDPKTFMALLERNPESMRHTQFLGVQDGLAILKVSTMSLFNQKDWKVSYVTTPLNQMPDTWIQKHPVPPNPAALPNAPNAPIRSELHQKKITVIAPCWVSKVPSKIYVKVEDGHLKVDLPKAYHGKLKAGENTWVHLTGICWLEPLGDPMTSESCEGVLKEVTLHELGKELQKKAVLKIFEG